MYGNRAFQNFFVVLVAACVLGASRDAAAAVNWDPVGNSTVFETAANWDGEDYTPDPALGDEGTPPGPDSRFVIGEHNYTVILSQPRTGTGAPKLGTFTVGDGSFAAQDPGMEGEETVGPGDEITTMVFRNDVTFTSIERDDAGAARGRPVRIGNNDRQPEVRLNGELDFPWGTALVEAGTFRLDSIIPPSPDAGQDQIRIGMNQDLQGGSLFEVSGTGKLAAPDKVRVGDRPTTLSSGNAVFRVRGSAMGTSITTPAISIDDFEVTSSIGLWDSDTPAEFENRLRFNRGKGIAEFALDAGGVAPIVVADDVRLGTQGTIPNTTPDHPFEGFSAPAYAFLRIKVSQPLLATTPGMAGQGPLTLIAADRISTTSTAIVDPTPLGTEFNNGRFFDPDRPGVAVNPGTNPEPNPAPHLMLANNTSVIANYAGATYTWLIEYIDPADDDAVIDTFIRLKDGVLSGTLGDLNGDTDLDEDDRTALMNAIASPPVTRYQMLGQAQNLFDLNADDFIDQLDLDVFNNFILAPPALTGDYNNDGFVDGADYVMWKKNNINGPTGYADWVEDFGESLAGSGGGNASVPEPASAALVLMGAVALLCRRPRQS
jgi:hypothetical protein